MSILHSEGDIFENCIFDIDVIVFNIFSYLNYFDSKSFKSVHSAIYNIYKGIPNRYKLKKITYYTDKRRFCVGKCLIYIILFNQLTSFHRLFNFRKWVKFNPLSI
jgi:hypothetical protein